MLKSDSPVMDFVTNTLAGYLLPPAKLDNKFSLLTPSRPSRPLAPTMQAGYPDLYTGLPVGMLDRLAYMNPGAQPFIGAAQQSLYDPRVTQQLSPQILQLLRQL